jgi:hypothetical protein
MVRRRLDEIARHALGGAAQLAIVRRSSLEGRMRKLSYATTLCFVLLLLNHENDLEHRGLEREHCEDAEAILVEGDYESSVFSRRAEGTLPSHN